MYSPNTHRCWVCLAPVLMLAFMVAAISSAEETTLHAIATSGTIHFSGAPVEFEVLILCGGRPLHGQGVKLVDHFPYSVILHFQPRLQPSPP
jgi:hypothetical protein